jgi:bisphosphoglycerate-independent phosphoglycerate mutase (AlkP superfamily)
MLNRPKPLVLQILDGFECPLEQEIKVIAMVNTPCRDKLQKYFAITLLDWSGKVLGLSGEQMGNSEVGHNAFLDGRDVPPKSAEASIKMLDAKFAELSVGIDAPLPGEDRLAPSPKVRICDLQPEMNAKEVTDHLVETIMSDKNDVIICNYENCDMVGRSGIVEVAIQVVEPVESSLQRMVEALKKVNRKLLLTVDYGNIEQMVDKETGQLQAAHTKNPIPLGCVHGDKPLATSGSLSDFLALAMLAILGMQQCSETNCKPQLESV